ncbi:Hypothetical predicted protein [Lecanosticta acicola]|uniref:Uncharacterized protein n=1 Tax=Lecanosticta acicola TaxID=111012 RepID=A0AAI9EEA4_9PEZI|nr:Hypothetical predicted protein [Lecanosticta acicola]
MLLYQLEGLKEPCHNPITRHNFVPQKTRQLQNSALTFERLNLHLSSLPMSTNHLDAIEIEPTGGSTKPLMGDDSQRDDRRDSILSVTMVRLDSPTPTLSSNLTQGGLLYEGNYDEWVARMDAILHVNGFEMYVSTHHLDFWQGFVGLPEWTQGRQDAAAIVCSQISPALRRRVLNFKDLPQNRIVDPFGLLSRIARPFPYLWKLPSEVRNTVYGYALGIHGENSISICEDYRRWPALLQVSREVRGEALKLYFSKGNFCLRLYQSVADTDRSDHMENYLWPWLRIIVRDNLKHLSRFTLECEVDRDVRIVKFAFSEGVLTVRHPKRLSSDSKTELGQKMSAAVNLSRLLNIGGESIALALLMDPHLWDSSTLKTTYEVDADDEQSDGELCDLL